MQPPILKTVFPEKWINDQDIDENLNSEFSNKYWLGEHLVHQPHLVGEILDFDEVRLALGFYAWTKGLKGYDPETMTKRYNFIVEVMEHYQDKIVGMKEGWEKVVLHGVTAKSNSKTTKGHIHSNINEIRIKEAWDKLREAIELLLVDKDMKTYKFRRTHLERYGITPKYIRKYAKEIVAYYRERTGKSKKKVKNPVQVAQEPEKTYSELVESLSSYEQDCLTELETDDKTPEEIFSEGKISRGRLDLLLKIKDMLI